MRVHGQKGVFQGHGAEESWLAFFAEGDRCGKLLPFQPDDCPSLLSGQPSSVGQQGGVGPGGGYVQGFQDGSGHLVNVAPVSTSASTSSNLCPFWSPISTVIRKVPIPFLYICASFTAGS